MVAFIIWSIAGCCFILLGIFSFISKKPIGFWANIKMFEVNDIRQYNNAMGKLWCSFGILFIVLGIPLLYGQNSPLIIISILGTMFEIIVYMIIYTQVIERKYNTARQKKD